MSDVYIAYRRGMGEIPAVAAYEALSSVGITVQRDPQSAESAAQAAGAAKFVLVVTPGTLDRCAEPSDPLRQTIEAAYAASRPQFMLISAYFDMGDLARYPSDALIDSKPIKMDYNSFGGSMANLAIALGGRPPMPPGEATTLRLRAQAHYERAIRLPLNDLNGKLLAYSEAIRLSPDFAAAYARRGAAQLANGDSERAIKDCEAALTLNPALIEAYNVLGMAYAKREDYPRAISNYTEAIRLNPRDARLYINRGVSHAYNNDLAAAIADYSAALAINPTMAEAYFNRSLAYGQQDEFELSIKDYSQAIALNLKASEGQPAPRAAEADIPSAVAYLEKMLRRWPDHPHAHVIRDEIARLQALDQRKGE